MPKKMHDILPPKLASKVEDTIKDLERAKKTSAGPAGVKSKPPVKVMRRKEPAMQMPPPRQVSAPTAGRKKRRFPLKELFIGGAVLVLLLCIYAYIKLPKADIQIWPKTSVLSLQEKITADKGVIASDVVKKIIPARYVEVVKQASQEFPATGNATADGRATGTIAIYNKTTSAFSLIKGTHFLSDGGKFFVTVAKVTIPAMQKNTPGSVSAPVQAEQVGSDYNIGPSKFSVPKLNGTAYYYSIYADSKSAMAGGYTGKVKKVTDDDLQSAKDVLSKQLISGAETALKAGLSQDEVLLDGAMASTVTDAGASAKSGAVTDTFDQHASVKSSALVFNKKDLEQFVKNNISGQLSGDTNYVPESLHVSYNPETPDIKTGKVVMNVKATATTYARINVADLLDLLARKSSDQVKGVVDQMYQGKVSQLKVNFWPFWVNKTPSDKNRITIEVNVQ